VSPRDWHELARWAPEGFWRIKEMAGIASKIEKDMKVADILKKYPRTIAVFNRYGIEACCMGEQSIEESAWERQIDLGQLMESLNNSC
jgi:regulator of cell morphogenesis and NO signaling